MGAEIDPLTFRLGACPRSELSVVTPHRHTVDAEIRGALAPAGIRVPVNHLATKNERRTAMTAVNSLIVNEVLRVQGPDAQRLGLDRLDEDALILGFARWAEGQLKKWLDYAKGALLFVMVPEESESGMFYIYDRARQTFFMVDLAEAGRYGGYRLEEFDQMAQTFGLKALAQNPRALAGAHCGHF